jgi:cysteine desulfurase
MKTYQDNGATTAVDKEVIKAMLPYFSKDYGNASSLHYAGQAAAKALSDSRKIFAAYINASPEEIIFTSGGTESDNLAIQGFIKNLKTLGEQKIHIITSKIEHPAVLNTCRELEAEGIEVSYIGVDKEGIINIEELKSSINPYTKLITIMHANNEIGTLQPLKEIGIIAKSNNIIFHSDAVQSLTKVPIDVKDLCIDMISFSAHKIHGPKGVGALYVRKGVKLSPTTYGGSHEFKKRPGTENIVGIVGFAKALSIAKQEDCEKMQKLCDRLIDGLLKIPNSMLNGSKEKRLCNNVNIGFEFIEGEGLLMHLSGKGICVSTGSACSSKSLEPSHVLAALGLRHEVMHGTLRFTLSKYTTEKEIDYTIKSVASIVKKLRKFSPLKEGVVYTAKDGEEDHHDHHCDECMETD